MCDISVKWRKKGRGWRAEGGKQGSQPEGPPTQGEERQALGFKCGKRPATIMHFICSTASFYSFFHLISKHLEITPKDDLIL